MSVSLASYRQSVRPIKPSVKVETASQVRRGKLDNNPILQP